MSLYEAPQASAIKVIGFLFIFVLKLLLSNKDVRTGPSRIVGSNREFL